MCGTISTTSKDHAMQMSANEIPLKTKSISDLLQYSFFIPSYQRGYRWTKQQVEDILNDIAEFSPKEIIGSNDKTWYCLQPIVVKDRGGKWDVIDGQQRLTTVYLILQYLNLGYAENRRKKIFTLQYETRTGSENYLKTLSEDSIDDSNIDYYFISSAYKNIAKWFKVKGKDFDTNGFESKFLHFTKVIWYETAVNDSIDIFTRINSGKIPLTNSELIKALFLNSSNFKDSDQEKIKLKQLEIASEWDKIEYTLQNGSFWYFLNTEKNPLPTRIEFILNLIADKPSNADEFYTFRHFNEKFKQHTGKEIAENWQEIKKYYQVLEEWFNDRELYHKIGFLIATGTNIKDIIKLKKELPKTELKKSIDSKIKEKVKVKIVNLEYGNGAIRNVLLLHNIQTMLNNTNETNRFPFDRYKNESWDVEHIAAIAEDMPTTELHQEDWLKETLVFIKDDELKRRASDYKKEDFKQIYVDILNHFSESKIHEDINDISNLVLLDAGTNRSYKNAVFAVKRNTIIDRDKKGTFIPVCTKNVFMKLYSSDVSQMTFWGESDRSAYSNDIIATLKLYLPLQTKSKNE